MRKLYNTIEYKWEQYLNYMIQQISYLKISILGNTSERVHFIITKNHKIILLSLL